MRACGFWMLLLANAPVLSPAEEAVVRPIVRLATMMHRLHTAFSLPLLPTTSVKKLPTSLVGASGNRSLVTAADTLGVAPVVLQRDKRQDPPPSLLGNTNPEAPLSSFRTLAVHHELVALGQGDSGEATRAGALLPDNADQKQKQQPSSPIGNRKAPGGRHTHARDIVTGEMVDIKHLNELALPQKKPN